MQWQTEVIAKQLPFKRLLEHRHKMSTLWSSPPVAAWHGLQSQVTGCPDLQASGDVQLAPDGVEMWGDGHSWLTAADNPLWNPTGPIGICAWVRRGQVAEGDWVTAIASYSITNSQRAWNIYSLSDSVRFTVSTTGSNHHTITVPFKGLKGHRFCVMADYDPSTGLQRLSVNGSAWVTNIVAGGGELFDSMNALQLGTFTGTSIGMDQGGVLPASIYHRTFTDQERADWWNNGFPLAFSEEPAPKTEHVVLCIGDSITFPRPNPNQDYLGRGTNSWPEALQALLGAGYLVDRIGAPGAHASHFVGMEQYLLTNRNAPVAVVAVGVNDIRQGATGQQVITHLDSIRSACEAAGVVPVICTINPFGGSQYNDWDSEKQAELEVVNAWVETLTNGANTYVAIVDTDGESAKPGYTYDGIHGNPIYGDAHAAVVAPLVQTAVGSAPPPPPPPPPPPAEPLEFTITVPPGEPFTINVEMET